VVGRVNGPDIYPIQPKPHTLEYVREVAHLRPRTNVIGTATWVRHSPAAAIHRFFDEHGSFWVNTPIIRAPTGAGALFRVWILGLANLPCTPDGKVDFAQDFFGREAFPGGFLKGTVFFWATMLIVMSPDAYREGRANRALT
jgi:asparaginyl-tRNA synthetase